MERTVPLAERMRPKSLEEYVGQAHLTGKDGIFSKMIRNKNIPSCILWGPPGSGKTTLALLLAQTLRFPFFTLSAISSGVKEIRDIIDKAKFQPKAILFIDEIHRFNKAQQDALLGAVENGTLTLIGATTENPSFEVNAALLSRCQVFVLKPLSEADLLNLLQRAVARESADKKINIRLAQTDALISLSGGDARKMLNLLEMTVNSADADADEITITDRAVVEVARQRTARYDKSGEQHYDIISAFIKSIRGSDPDAALYWLARMLAGGEDPQFIARRLLILASEDIGNANPNALLLANTCFQAVSAVGMPESDLILSQTTIYLACSPKSNSAYKAIRKAQEAVEKFGDLPVPLHLRNAPTQLMKKLGYGADYLYPHDYPENFTEQQYLPYELKEQVFYQPADNEREQEMAKRQKKRWKNK
ncbi:replication-associated recombination protein A [Rhodoflexus caldus]|uniref:replication-associated recombination protein A n=1 Tax=Rhodoflexus caldus TaxID=2891236 RepID=UPI00202A900C|nr:replication-associated recombination protein A [Rhodoflexus caldus]